MRLRGNRVEVARDLFPQLVKVTIVFRKGSSEMQGVLL